MAFRVFKLIQNIHFKAIFWTILISRKTQDCSWEPRSGEQGDQNVSEQGHPGPEECCQKVWDFEDLCSEHSQVQEHQALSQSKGAGSGAKPQGYLGTLLLLDAEKPQPGRKQCQLEETCQHRLLGNCEDSSEAQQ